MTILAQTVKARRRYDLNQTKLNLNRMHKVNLMRLKQIHSSILNPFL